MKQLSALVIATALVLGLPAYAGDDFKHVQPADLIASKELLDEARSFLRVARTSLEKLDSVSEKLSLAVYYAGVKDGALGAVLVLVLIYLMFMHRKAS